MSFFSKLNDNLYRFKRLSRGFGLGVVFNNKDGFSLLSVIVGGALSVSAIYLLSHTQTQTSKVAKRIELRNQLENLRQTIRDQLSCTDTTGNPGWDKKDSDSWAEYLPCEPGKDYTNELKNKRGKPLLGPGRDDYENLMGLSVYKLRATCVDKSTGIIIEYQRQNSGKAVNDPNTGKPQEWKNLFADSGITSFCMEQFGDRPAPETCADDEVLVDIAPDGEPKCEKAYLAADFQLCIQFSDHGCKAQQGEVQCTPCTSEAAEQASSGKLLQSPWASDANAYNPDCARIFTRACNSGELPSGEVNVWQPIPITRDGCNVKCADNEIMIGFQASALGEPPAQSCKVTCVEDDVPTGAGAVAIVTPFNPNSRPPCPAPVATGVINGGGPVCNKACTKKLRDGAKFIFDYVASLDPRDPLRKDPRIRGLKKNKGNKKSQGLMMYNQIVDAAFVLQCNPFPNSSYRP